MPKPAPAYTQPAPHTALDALVPAPPPSPMGLDLTLHLALVFTALAALATALATTGSSLATDGRHSLALRLASAGR